MRTKSESCVAEHALAAELESAVRCGTHSAGCTDPDGFGVRAQERSEEAIGNGCELLCSSGRGGVYDAASTSTPGDCCRGHSPEAKSTDIRRVLRAQRVPRRRQPGATPTCFQNTYCMLVTLTEPSKREPCTQPALP